jgi:hypothetical protein
MPCYRRTKPPPRPRRADLDDRAEKARRRRAVEEWTAVNGPVCPGYERPAHLATDLCADHVVEVVLGGPAQPAGFAVLCRSCNSTKSNLARSRATTSGRRAVVVPDRDW